MKKRILSLILSVCMLVSLLPINALAAVVPEPAPIVPIEYNISTNALTEAAKATKYDNNTLGLVSWLAKGSAEAATLDVPAKTAAYQMTNRIGSMKDNSPTLLEKGFSSQFVVDAWSDVGGTPTFSNHADHSNYTKGLIVYGVRLKVPAGKYTLSLKNDFAIGDVANTFKSNGAFTKGAVTKVYFGKAETNASSSSEAFSAAKAVVSDDNYLGWYSSMDLSQTTSYAKELTVSEDGEYFVTFVADADSLTKNGDCYFRDTGWAFQQFYLSGITLTPVPPEGYILYDEANYDITSGALTDTALTDHGAGASFDGNELSKVSWLAKGSVANAALDLTKTDGYELEARKGGSTDTSLTLGNLGFNGRFISEWRDKDATTGAISEPTNGYCREESPYVYGIKINVPNDGEYTLSLKNNYTSDDIDNSYKVKGKFARGVAAKVTLTRVQPADVATSAALGQAATNLQIKNALAASSSTHELGWYDSTKLAIDENTPYITDFDKKLKLSAGEYFVVFEANTESLEINPEELTVNDQAKAQFFCVSGISLRSALPKAYSGYTAVYDLTSASDFKTATYEKTNNLWQFAGTDADNASFTTGTNSVSFDIGTESFAEVEINVPVKGRYRINLSHEKADLGAVGAVYINGEKLGTVDYSKASGDNYVGTYEFESAGKYKVKFKAEGGIGTAQTPGTLTLYGGGKRALVNAELSLSDNVLSVSRAWLSDGSEADASKLSVKYSIDGTASAEIDKNTGVITPKVNSEFTTLYATISLDGVSVDCELYANVVKDLPESMKGNIDTIVYNITSDVLWSGALGTDNSGDDETKDAYDTQTADDLISNNELGYISWLARLKNPEPALDLTKTAPYQLGYRLGGSVDNSPALYVEGFVSQFVVKQWNPGDDITTAEPIRDNYGTKNKILYSIRLKVDEPGKYKLALKNSFTKDSTRIHTTFRTDGEFTKGAVTQVHFAKAKDAAADNAYTTPAKAAESLDENAVTLGWYDSRRLAQNANTPAVTEFDTVLDIAEAGEYYVYFEGNNESLEKNPDVYYRNDGNNNSWFQQFMLSGIELVPVLPTGYSGSTAVYDLTVSDVFENATYDNTGKFWAFKGTDAQSAVYNVSENAVSFDVGTDAYTAVEINVPISGKYRVGLDYATSPDGGVGAVYVLDPGTSDIAASLSDSTELGAVNYHAPQKGTGTTVLGEYSFTVPGKYIVVFKHKSGTGTLQSPKTITLDGGDSRDVLMDIELNLYGEQIVVNGILTDGTDANLTNADITYGISDGASATVDSLTGVVTPVLESEDTTVWAEVTLDGMSLKKELAVKIKKTEYSKYTLTYDFATVDGVTDGHKITYGDTMRFWEFEAENGDFAISKQSYGLRADAVPGNWFALKFYVPAVGTYHTELLRSTASYGGDSEMYVLPAGADIESAINGGSAKYLGEIKSYSAMFGENTLQLLDNITFDTIGEYIVVFRSTDVGGKGQSSIMPGKLSFVGGGNPALTSVITDLDEVVVNVGASRVLTVIQSMQSDYVAAFESAYDVTFEIENTDIAKVYDDGTVAGLAVGETTLTVTAVMGDTVAVKSHKVKVLPRGYAGYTLKYDFANVPVFEETTYESTHNFWQYYGSDADWTAVEVNIPEAGKYALSTDAGFSGEIYIGTTVDNVQAVSGECAFATAGSYLVMFKNSGGAVPETLTLYGGDGAVLMGVDVAYADYMAYVSNAYMSDGTSLDVTKADIMYSIADFEKGAVISENGKVFLADGGKTSIFADVTYEGKTVRGEVSVDLPAADPDTMKASGESVLYNLVKRSTSWQGHNGNKTYIGYITYDMTDGNWEWYMTDKSNPTTMAYSSPRVDIIGNERLEINLDANNWLALKIKVPAEGRYWINEKSSRTSRLKSLYIDTGKLFFIPVGASIEEIEASLTPETMAGKISYLDNSLDAWTVVSEDLGSVYFPEAGEYLMVYQEALGLNAKRVEPIDVSLDGTNRVRFLDIEVDGGSELAAGSEADLAIRARLLDGTLIDGADATDVTYKWSSSDESVAKVSDGKLVAIGDGTALITLEAVYPDNVTVKTVERINVIESATVVGIEIVGDKMGFVDRYIPLSVNLVFDTGTTKALTGTAVMYTAEGDGADVKGNSVSSSKPGTIKVSASAIYQGAEYNTETPLEIEFKAHTMKSEPSYYTYDRLAALRENAEKYDWVQSQIKSAKKSGDTALENFDRIYEMLIPEGLPRASRPALREDPEYNLCHYCGANVSMFGDFTMNIYTNPWKIQCPDCRRNFPSNDFGSFYKIGLDEHGYFDVTRARERHHNMLTHGSLDAVCDCVDIPTEEKSDAWYDFYGYGDPNGYLYNEAYTELWADSSKDTYNKDPYKGVEVDGARWGVDDGWGYDTGRIHPNGVAEVHTYIATYLYVGAVNEVNYAIRNLARAYAYTGEEKYGIQGAILLDRLADVYPDYSTHLFFDKGFATGGGGTAYGKVKGTIGDSSYIMYPLEAADAFFPLLVNENETLLKALQEKAKEFNLENPKTTGEHVWQNWADGIVRETFRAAKSADIYGNVGYQERAVSLAILVLNSKPESDEMTEWLFATGGRITRDDGTYYCPGGNLGAMIMNVLDRDGNGNESSPSYHSGWVPMLQSCAEYLNMYTDDPKYNLFKNPKFAQLFISQIPLVLVDDHTAQIGDTGSPADNEIQLSASSSAFMELKDTPLGNIIAEELYRENGYTAEGLRYDMFTHDPERLEQEVLERIDLGDGIMRESTMLTGYGFAVLRDGAENGDKNTATYTNNMRDWWIYFGSNQHQMSHTHKDTLNLGFEAYGLNMAPDLGYPEATGANLNRFQWIRQTISHNTVTVNETAQIYNQRKLGPMHFDDSGDIKLMDIDGHMAYDATDIYRRTLVSVNVGADVSYAVDFFRVKGGHDHIYSFHSQSDEIYETVGLDNIEYQTDNGRADGNYIGSYAGADVKFGDDPSLSSSKFTYPGGYTWMKNVRRDTSGVSSFTVDFNVTDFRKVLKDGKDLHLRMTMLNDGYPLDEVALTSGYVQNSSHETTPGVMPETFEYVLARRKGTNLDTLYTTVFEPYRNNRYLTEMSDVPVEMSPSSTASEGKDDIAKAVKVVRTDGRVDYIVYATNNNVLYTVTDSENGISFNFRGFVGVYSVNADKKNIYSYVNDGDIICNTADMQSYTPHDYKAYTGTVDSFTKELSWENKIYVKTSDTVDTSKIIGNAVYVNNDGVQSGAYMIKDAVQNGDILELDIGTVSAIRSYADVNDFDKGYVYNIGIGQGVTIPISNIEDYGPRFDKAYAEEDFTATAGSTFTTTISAMAEDLAKVSYYGTNIPRGATVDENTGKVTWKPDASQTGNNHFQITARDEYGRENTESFIVTVYGSTTGSPSTGNDSTDSTETPSGDTSGGGGGGGGGGGAAPAPDTDENVGDDEGLLPEEKVPSEGEADEVENGDTTNLRFTDLGSHAWAVDAINELAEKGIIKGTSDTTFSPSANITRADFALLLVRAFDLKSDNNENFADVSASDYFAAELAIARNTGIVGGIGDNKYAPRNTITRQDMMVIVYRALQKLGVELEIADVDYEDFADVADYAQDAVKALITSGLVNGKNGKIAPADYTTRAEVAVLLKRILDYTAK